MPGRVTKPTFSLSDLSNSVSKIFDQAQVSTANHQKNFVALYKLQTEAAIVVERIPKGLKFVGERAFGDVYLRMTARVLPVKKGATVVDRVVKFVSGYVKFINEKGKRSVDRNLHHHLQLLFFCKPLNRKQPMPRTRARKTKILQHRVLWRDCSNGCSKDFSQKTRQSGTDPLSW
jgi:hypothetical protein